MDECELQWATGLYEGEGSITLSMNSPRLVLPSNDKDVLDKLQSILGGRVTGPYMSKSPLARHPSWRWALYGDQAIAIAEKMYPHLSRRRRGQIDVVIERLAAIRAERQQIRPCRVCWKGFVPNNPRYASRTFYCSEKCKRLVSNGYVPAQKSRGGHWRQRVS